MSYFACNLTEYSYLKSFYLEEIEVNSSQQKPGVKHHESTEVALLFSKWCFCAYQGCLKLEALDLKIV